MLTNTSAWTHHRDVPNHGCHRGYALILYKLCVQTYLCTRSHSSDEIFDACGVILVGIGLHIHNSSRIWRIPFAFQLVPTGIMALGLLTVPESPRWLASKGRSNEALENLAYLRRRLPSSQDVLYELAEIEAALAEEREARAHLGPREAFFGRGNLPRFLIAFFIFFLQQWCGQNSVGYYAPQIFTSVRNLFLFDLCLIRFRSVTRVPPTRFSLRECTVWSRSSQRQYSSFSFSMPGDGNLYCLSLPLGWEPCFSSSVLSSRYIRQRQLHNPILLLRGGRWQQ
jgi:MFS family permease